MRKSWLIAPIAFSAFVATWGGWVTLAKMTGFGDVNMLPGLVDDGTATDRGWSTIDLSIALPIGVEAYGALALAVAFDRKATTVARWFAAVSAVLSLTLAGIGQAIAHNLVSENKAVAPPHVTSFVSVLPVIVLGMASALAVLSQGRVSTTSRPASRWAGMVGRLAEAATDRAVSQLSHPSESPRRDDWDVPPGNIPTSPPPAGMNIPAAHGVTSRSPAPRPPSHPATRAVAAEKDPALVGRAAEMLRESPRPTVVQLAERLELSRATAGRVAKVARSLPTIDAPPELDGVPADDPVGELAEVRAS